MQAKTILAALATFTVIGAANAQTRTYTWTGGTNGNWKNAGNWTRTGPSQTDDWPHTSVDKAVIVDKTTDPTLEADISVGYLQVQNLGVLTIGSGNELTVSQNAQFDVDQGGLIDVVGKLKITGSGTHPVEGEVRLSDQNSVLEIAEDITFSNSHGEIVGQHNSARVNIGPGDVFTIGSSFEIRGHLGIEGLTEGLGGSGEPNGAFVNNGKVFANASGVLEIMSGLSALSGDGDWEVSHATGILRFNRATTSDLGGPFELGVSGSTLDINKNVKTIVDIVYNNGTIDVASGATFTFGDGSGNDSTGTCGTQPTSPLSNTTFQPCS